MIPSGEKHTSILAFVVYETAISVHAAGSLHLNMHARATRVVS